MQNDLAQHHKQDHKYKYLKQLELRIKQYNRKVWEKRFSAWSLNILIDNLSKIPVDSELFHVVS